MKIPKKISARSAGAFSMVEILVATAILGILATIVTTAANSAMATAAKAREISAGRNLINAYLQKTTDDGLYPAGYDRTVGELEWPDGTQAHGPSAQRYPFRLGEYYDYRLEGVILVNENARQVEVDDTYSVSLLPAFGINYLFIGGDRAADGSNSLPGEVLTRPAMGANVLVFASSARQEGDSVTHGFNLLTPPRTYSAMWTSAAWTPQANPNHYGNIHARHGNRAVCVFLDGSVRLMEIEELRDMTLWSMRAAQANDPDYTIARAQPPSRRR
jgi:prepilin-type N-terminal cleavage/methylation domain-containing protein/prepilin-type processing-associated H-X9-DG protein